MQAKKGRLVIRQKKRGVLSADVYSIIGTVALDLELYVDCITGVELTLPLAECAYVGSAISFTLLPKHVEQVCIVLQRNICETTLASTILSYIYTDMVS